MEEMDLWEFKIGCNQSYHCNDTQEVQVTTSLKYCSNFYKSLDVTLSSKGNTKLVQ